MDSSTYVYQFAYGAQQQFVDLKEKIVKVIIKTAAMFKNVNNKNTFFIITRSPLNIVNSAKMFFKNTPLSHLYRMQLENVCLHSTYFNPINRIVLNFYFNKNSKLPLLSKYMVDKNTAIVFEYQVHISNFLVFTNCL